MASRRIRIKGIANIPQRKKSNTSEQEIPKEENSNDVTIINNGNKSNLTYSIDKTVTDVKTENNAVTNTINDSLVNPPESTNNSINNVGNIQENDTEVKQSNNTEPAKSLPNPKEVIPKPAARRKFMKPQVSLLNAANRKSRVNGENETNTIVDKADVKAPACEKVVVLEEQVIRPSNVEIVRAASPQKPPHVFNAQDILLNETHFLPNGHNNSRIEVLSNDRGSQKPLPYIVPLTPTSDTDYPPPPPSPSKINRSRIKAIPRLNQRKTSFSASESEDESRRHYNRNRNDSVCSVSSITPDLTALNECMSPQRPGREFNSVIREKCKKKVHSRKLAEARRQFNLKYFGSNPDRQKLTMIDLIFYNPSTNPMKYNERSKPSETAQEETVDDPPVAADVEEAVVDDPAADDAATDDPPAEASKSDEENEMPVPQLKVGPQGEIILDEKSLVVESKGTKRGREELQKSKVVEGDFDTGYGMYKRAKRAKDWASAETLRFYKALNIIGTDFTLMCELFPKRNRRELKLKFKKEEKINKGLIDKALMNPCQFEFFDLKQEVDMEEKELELIEKQKAEEIKLKKEKSNKIYRNKKVGRIPPPIVVKKPLPEKVDVVLPKKRRLVKKPLNIMSVTEESDADESNIESESEADFEIINPPKPTRCGRVPKIRKEIDWEVREEMMKVSKITRVRKIPDEGKDVDDQQKKLEPGSLMIIPTSKNEVKILMVTPDGTTTPINLNNDALTKVMDYKQCGQNVENILTISAERRQSVAAIEYNVTIPAPEEGQRVLENGDCSEKRNEVNGITEIMNKSVNGNDESCQFTDIDMNEN